jgi:hydrogenase nickel incorporation protein HypB
MCQDCGCSAIDPQAEITIDGKRQSIYDSTQVHTQNHNHHDHDHDHADGHTHDHAHDPHTHHHEDHGQTPGHETLHVAAAILAKNDRLAADNRDRFSHAGILALNLLSSPGAGKTALLERTLVDLSIPAAVIVGDLATDNDAARLKRVGARAIPIATGNVCHLEASMVGAALDRLDLDEIDLLFIENVGNLVCPAAYDLGEAMKVVLFSVTEGEDKPLKYPTTFKNADVVLLTKTDIAEAVGCDLALARQNVHAVAPQAELFELSARSGAGMTDWYFYLQTRLVRVPQMQEMPWLESSRSS